MEEKKKTFNVRVKEQLKSAKIDKSCCKKAFEYGKTVFGKDDFIFLDKDNIKCPSCVQTFLRGVFLSNGNVNSPDKGHHLEIDLKTRVEADELSAFLAENGFDVKTSKRRNKSIVYFKDGDTIFGFLSFIGAQKSAFEFLETIIEMQVRNDCNRKSNFDTANIKKSTNSGVKHVKAIKYLLEHKIIDNMSDKLRYTAVLKLENPSLTLSELAEIHDPPITKSCVNHRLEKIVEKYENSVAKKGK